jgi:23S rRNA (cytosine1962-C5)-methyltransferase
MHSPDQLRSLLRGSLDTRGALLARLRAEGTDAYRLLHGATEGCEGLTVDRYGPLLWVQSFREPLPPGGLEALCEVASEVLGQALVPVWNHRSRQHPGPPGYAPPPEAAGPHIVREGGLAYEIAPRPWGKDPWLFLDFRAARRWVRTQASGAEVLNLFAYTCGIGVAAGAGGAKAVCNVDFAASALAVGRRNAAHNDLDTASFETVQADFIPTVRQLAGLPVKGRAAQRRRFPRFQPRAFDLVVLDPPTWATSPFGAIDPVRDYASLLKPCLLCTRPGGRLLVTNHVSTVELEGWLAGLERCATKAGRPLRGLEVLPPDPDFPSPDGRHPLKVAVLST